MKIQKQIRNIVIGLFATLGTSFAVADSAPNTANSAQHTHAAYASSNAQQGLSTADWRYVGGEPGWIHEVGQTGSRTGKTRAQVQKELVEYKNNPGAQLRHLSLYIRG